jgi:hypothetical protein
MRLVLALGVVLSSATAVMAQAPRNPSDVQCRSSNATGSRLARTRVCMTRAEWAEIRRTSRQAIDRAQTRQFNRTIDEKGKMTN